MAESLSDNLLTAAEADELRRLVWALRDDGQDAANIARLEELVCQRADGPDQYILAADLMAGLFWCFGQSEAPSSAPRDPSSDEPVEAAESAEPNETAWLAELISPEAGAAVLAPRATVALPIAGKAPIGSKIAATLLTALAFYGTFTALAWNLLDEGRGARLEARGARGEARGARDPLASDLAPRASSLAPPSSAVATVTGEHDAHWSAPANKSAITPGEPLTLASGRIALQLKRGVALVVEGPAAWTVDGDNNVTLTHGKLVASVPKRAIGFTVDTPTTRIVDLGTEFGVQVDTHGHTDTQVFKGEVRVAAPSEQVPSDQVPAGQASPAQQPISLRAGQAAHIASDGTVSFIGPLATGPEQFLKAVPAVEPSPYARSVMQTAPVTYWDFSQTQNETTLGQDRMQGYPFDLFQPHRVNDFGLVAANGFPGMGEINVGVSMQAGTHSVRVDHATSKLKVPVEHYSMQIWFCPTQPFKRQPNHCLAARGNGTEVNEDMRDALMLMGGHTPKYMGRLVYFNGDYKPIRFTAGKTVLSVGQWYQAILVRDGDTIRIYLNGELECEEARPWLGGSGEMISFGQRPDYVHFIGFVGQFDEVALWNRALTAAEARRLYHSAVTLTP